MRPIRFLVPVCLFAACSDPPPEVGTQSAALVGIAVESVGPEAPVFERIGARTAGDGSANLNFEMRVRNSGNQPFAFDRLDIAYTGPGNSVSPQVSRNELRDHYIFEAQRPGFGPTRVGTWLLNLPMFIAETFTDVKAVGADAYATVRGTEEIPSPDGGMGTVKVARFHVTRLGKGQEVLWGVNIPFGWDSSADALVAADDDNSAFVAAGETHAFGGLADFAVAQVDADDGDLAWSRTVNFPGCEAKAVDVERVPHTTTEMHFLVVGNVNCGGNKDVGAVMLDSAGAILWQRIYDPGIVDAIVGGAAVDLDDDEIYIVGRLGPAGMVLNTDVNNNPDVTFNPGGGAGGGQRLYTITGHTDLMFYEAQVLADNRIAMAAEAKRSDGNMSLILFRILDDSNRDLILKGAGWVAAAFPGLTSVRGRDLEVFPHGTGTWYTVNGISDLPSRNIVAAAFEDDGDPQTAFDGDGKLIIPGFNVNTVARSALDGDWITVVGGAAGKAAGARYHRLEGTLDDPTILSAGATAGMLWPDTGIDDPDTEHLANVWQFSSLPTSVTATFRLRPFPSGSVVPLNWVRNLSLFTASSWGFPGLRLDQLDTQWYALTGHDITTDHRRDVSFSTEMNRYRAPDRHAYDLTVRRWTGSMWTEMIGPNNGENDNYLAYGQPVFPIAGGDIVRCWRDVETNPETHDHTLADSCNESGVPCYYTPGGNGFLIVHDGGEVSYYGHLDPDIDTGLCPAGTHGGQVSPPVHVTRSTQLGVIGNTGDSDTPHLHVALGYPWDEDPYNAESAPGEFQDGMPLMFDGVMAVSPELRPTNLPDPEDIAFPVTPHSYYGDTLLYMPEPPEPESTEDCQPVVPPGPGDWGGMLTEANQADGDAPPGGLEGYYCPDVDGVVRVCVEDKTSGKTGCVSCDDDGGPWAGCPCDGVNDCPLGMACFGLTVSNNEGIALPGRCYPTDEVPSWMCTYDCRANLGEYAWCYNQHPSGTARCIDGETNWDTITSCWEEGPLATYGDACFPGECIDNAECHGDATPGHGYPDEYVCNIGVAAGMCILDPDYF